MFSFISIFLNWILVGYFICVKREWYKDESDKTPLIVGNFFLAPIALLIAFIRIFIVDKWDNTK